MNPRIIPAILAKTRDEARAKFEAINAVAPLVQLDVLDGTLYPYKSWHDAEMIQSWRIKPAIELHLMVKDPTHILRAWKNVNNLRRVIWHVEAPVDHAMLIRDAHAQGIETGLAIAPGTHLSTLKPYLHDIQTVLVLGVHPGKSGQSMLSHTYERIDTLHTMTRLPIGLDGGVTHASLRACVRHGVTHIYTASALFNTKDPKQTFRELTRTLTLS